MDIAGYIIIAILVLAACAATGFACFFYSARNILTVWLKVSQRREARLMRQLAAKDAQIELLHDRIMFRAGFGENIRPQPAPGNAPDDRRTFKRKITSPAEAIARHQTEEITGPPQPDQHVAPAPDQTVPPAIRNKMRNDPRLQSAGAGIAPSTIAAAESADVSH